MALSEFYILYQHNTDKPLSRKRYMKELVMNLVKNVDPVPAPQAVVTEDMHTLSHLPGRQARVCPVCGEKSTWWYSG